MNKTIVIFLVLSLVISAQSKDDLSINISKTESGHTFILSISKKLFNPKLHDLSKIQFNFIDSDTAYGIDGSIPKYEIDTISLKIDNQNILIPKIFYKNFFNPSIEYSGEYKNVDAFFNNNYQTVVLFMNASDGAAAYPLVMLLNKNGNHSFVKLSMEDIFFNFLTN